MRRRIEQVLESARITDNLARFERAYTAYAEQSIAERVIARLLENPDIARLEGDTGARA
jgi:hypothetical protein